MENDDKIAVENKAMATTKKRNVYKPEFKAKVTLEAVRGRLPPGKEFIGISKSKK